LPESQVEMIHIFRKLFFFINFIVSSTILKMGIRISSLNLSKFCRIPHSYAVGMNARAFEKSSKRGIMLAN
jgi:hypothetical protein